MSQMHLELLSSVEHRRRLEIEAKRRRTSVGDVIKELVARCSPPTPAEKRMAEEAAVVPIRTDTTA
jgi:hypothetical protein